MYKELIEGSYKQRKKNGSIVEKSSIKQIPCDHERYMSLFTFDNSIQEYYKLNESIKGYQGKIYADAFWFDIDSEDLETARGDTLKLIVQFSNKYNLATKNIYIYFSGSKGFHLAIPEKVFGKFEPSNDLPDRFKMFAELIGIDSVDTAIYEPVRIFRINNSLNEKSGLYKIQLTFDELQRDIDYIKGKAKQPRATIPQYVDYNESLANDFKQVKVLKQDNKVVNTDGFFLPGNKGERNNKLFKQACMLVESGLHTTSIYELLQSVNNNSEAPIDNTELKSIIESARQKTQPKQVEQELLLKTMADMIPDYLYYLSDERKKLSLKFPSFDDNFRGKLRGQLGCIIGKGGSKKSLLAMNVCLHNALNYNSICIYSNMEMSNNKLVDRIIDYTIDGDSYNASFDIQQQYKKDKVLTEQMLYKIAEQFGNNILITDNYSLTYKEYDKLIEEAKSKYNEVDILVVDGLSMMGGKGSETEIYSKNTKDLKELAKKWNIFIMLICHVTKEAEYHTRDLLRHVRGSEKILDNCDFVLMPSQLIDLAKSEGGVLEYMNDKGYIRMYDKRGTGNTINKIFDFNLRKLSLSEVIDEPSNYEVDIKKEKSWQV